MKNRLSYFMFNKLSDYERGCLVNFQYNNRAITVSESSRDSGGSFLSRVLDSYESEMNWHRLRFDVAGNTDGAYKVTVYASDSLNFVRGEELYRIDELIRSRDRTLEEKLDLLEPFIQKQLTGMHDMLLHDVVGRYLWILLEAYVPSGEELSVSNLTIYLPRCSWLEYLPAVYQSSDLQSGFLERFLGIFQTSYEDLNFKIFNAADYLDADCGDEGFLQWLAEWLDLADSYLWPEDKLRRLLSRSVELYLRRGTRKSVEDIVELYTGRKPYLVETFQLEKYRKSEAYEKTLLPMYGDNPMGLTVLVREGSVGTAREYSILLRIIEEMKPVQMELKLIVLRPYIYLNQYSYLGINSVLGQYRDASLDGTTQMTLAVINH